jgi:hypothetical protein
MVMINNIVTNVEKILIVGPPQSSQSFLKQSSYN